MKYNFDKVTDRRSSDSLKWDVAEGELPMWVADMDFEAAPEITAWIQERVKHGIFGYTVVPEMWYEAYRRWWEKRHHFRMEKEWLLFAPGIVPAICSMIKHVTGPEDKVLIQPPVYNHFYSAVLNNGRRVAENPLRYDGERYEMDFDDLERKLSDPETTLMILCNPQNPGGRIWEKETLMRVGRLCRENQVIVISDEIHCDLTMPGCEYVPFASVSEDCRENSITCIAPSKTFNLAGFQTSALVVPEEKLRQKVCGALLADEIAEPNVFAAGVAAAAFTMGEAWLDELRQYLAGNRKYAEGFLERELPDVKAVPSEATYLLWLDCSNITRDADDLAHFLREETGLFVTEGSQYGTGGECFLRINIACPEATLRDGLERLKRGCVGYSFRKSK